MARLPDKEKRRRVIGHTWEDHKAEEYHINEQRHIKVGVAVYDPIQNPNKNVNGELREDETVDLQPLTKRELFDLLSLIYEDADVIMDGMPAHGMGDICNDDLEQRDPETEDDRVEMPIESQGEEEEEEEDEWNYAKVGNKENWEYGIGVATGRNANKTRDATINRLQWILGRIIDAKVHKQDLNDQKLLKHGRYGFKNIEGIKQHHVELSPEGSRVFLNIVWTTYKRLHHVALLRRKSEINPEYYHPLIGCDADNQDSASTSRKLLTFTEINVNEWSVGDTIDPSIKFSSVGMTQTPKLSPEPNTAGYSEATAAFKSMALRTQMHEENLQAWERFTKDQIERLKQKYLSAANTDGAVRLKGKRGNKWTLVYKLGEDPPRAVFNMFLQSNRVEPPGTEMIGVLNELLKMIALERNTDGSDVQKLHQWEMDLKLRCLRKEISKKLKRMLLFFQILFVCVTEISPRAIRLLPPAYTA
jgi:hypothetical protein